MKNIYRKILVLGTVMMLSIPVSAQIYGKINGLYALAGVINPAVEFRLSPHSTFQTEFVFSPWNSIRDHGVSKPMLFGIFMNEYRYYLRQHNSGLYFGANGGIMVFNMAKPVFEKDRLLKDVSGKGYGFMFGLAVGYQWKLGERFLLDAFVGFSYTVSHYNAYALVDGVVEGGHVYNKGEVILTPGATPTDKIDPWNGSGQWLPNKIGLSFGMLLFDPNKSRK